MALQNRLANVPGMFSEGVEDNPAGKARRLGERSIVGRLGSAAIALATSLGSRGSVKASRVSVQPG